MGPGPGVLGGCLGAFRGCFGGCFGVCLGAIWECVARIGLVFVIGCLSGKKTMKTSRINNIDYAHMLIVVAILAVKNIIFRS